MDLNIELEHPEYVVRAAMRRKYRDLYAGGEQMREQGPQYLIRRQKEGLDVYGERLQRAFYQNYIGSIIDWYAATVFRREPTLNYEATEATARFYTAFTENCDQKGNSLTAFFRHQLIEALVEGVSYTLVDFPEVRETPENRAQEEASGRSRAYLVDYSAENLTNWEVDDRGHFEWVVLRQSQFRKSAKDDSWQKVTRWTYYDRENYRSFRRVSNGTGLLFGVGEQGPVELTGEGRHALAAQHRVPLFELRVSEGFWLMNKAALLQLEHYNQSNALSWALTMGLFPIPVIYSARSWSQIAGESYYIQLGPDDRFGWNEPEGHVYQLAADNLVRLQEEIYRVCYLLGQAGTPSGVQVSGLSKQRDFAITQEVLRNYGDRVKDTLRQVLEAVSEARQDEVAISVTGLDDFDINDFAADLSDAERLLSLGIPSPTLERLVHQRLASKYLCDARQEVKAEIFREIEAATRKRAR